MSLYNLILDLTGCFKYYLFLGQIRDPSPTLPSPMSCQSHQISLGPLNLNRIKYSKTHPCNTCVLSLEGSFDDALIRIQELEVELLIKCLRYFALKKNGCPWPFLDYIYIHLLKGARRNAFPNEIGFSNVSCNKHIPGHCSQLSPIFLFLISGHVLPLNLLELRPFKGFWVANRLVDKCLN